MCIDKCEKIDILDDLKGIHFQSSYSEMKLISSQFTKCDCTYGW